MADFTNKELAAEAKRESAMRRRVYGRWVQENRNGMTQERADVAIAKMDAIAAHFDKLAAAEAEAIAPHLL
jgi:ribonuclease HI